VSTAIAARTGSIGVAAEPLEAHVDAVMSRAVAMACAQTERRMGPPRHFSQWMAYLPGTSLDTVFREDAATALAALREALVKRWLAVIRELVAWERSQKKRRAC